MPILPDNYASMTQGQKDAYFASLNTAAPTAQTAPTYASTTPTTNPNFSGVTTNNTYSAPANTPYSAPKSPVSVLSSQAGANIVNQNTETLQKIEAPYTGSSLVDYLKSVGNTAAAGSWDSPERQALAKQYGIQNYTGTAEQNTQLLQALRNTSSSPASQTMIADINKVASAGGMTPEEQQGLANLQSQQDLLTEAAAKARAALDSGDYKTMDFWTKRADEQRAKLESATSDYFKQLAPLRQQLIQNMTPGQREQQLGQQLQSLRNQIDQFKLQTEEDKFNEFQGQTLGFAGGRASEIDIRAQFKMSRMALEEKNLLASLGLEQEARKMQGLSIEQQMNFIKDDFEVQSKLDERLSQMEEDLFNKADKLEANAKSSLMSILDMLQGTDPSKMNAQMLTQLQTMAARSGLPFDLVKQALSTQYQRQVFEDSLKLRDQANQDATARRLNGGGTTSSSTGSTSTSPTGVTTGITSGVPDWFRDQAKKEWTSQVTSQGGSITSNPLTEQMIQTNWSKYLAAHPEAAPKAPSVWSKYNTATGKTLSTEQEILSRAGLKDADGRLQEAFLNLPPAIRSTLSNQDISGDLDLSVLTVAQLLELQRGLEAKDDGA